MVIDERFPLLSPMSPMKRHFASPQGADAMSSQSSSEAPATRARDLSDPSPDTLKMTGWLPASLCVQKREGSVRLLASPLVSFTVMGRGRIAEATSHAAGVATSLESTSLLAISP